MKFTKILFVVSVIIGLFLSGCGGSSGSNAASTDIYNIDAYKPIANVEPGLEGVWLLVMEYESESQYIGEYYDADDRWEKICKLRMLISISKSGDNYQAAIVSDYGNPYVDNSWTINFREDNLLVISDSYEGFSGVYSDSGVIYGEYFDYYYTESPVENIVTNSRGGMVKISNDPIGQFNAFGSIIEKTPENEESVVNPVHLFVESYVEFTAFNNEGVRYHNKIKIFSAYSIDPLESLNDAYNSEGRFAGVGEIIEGTWDFEFGEGWFVRVGQVEGSAAGSGFFSAENTDPMIDISNTKQISVIYLSDDNETSLNIDVAL